MTELERVWIEWARRAYGAILRPPVARVMARTGIDPRSGKQFEGDHGR